MDATEYLYGESRSMKKIVFLFIFLCTAAVDAATICLNMIVKNETKVIRRCLESVMPLIDTWVIVDTGSTDGTQKLIKEIMKDIPGELHERPWVDFAHNRNEALQFAKGKADYILFVDADDILTFDPKFVKPQLDKDSYSLNIAYAGTSYSRTQLVKSSLDWKWVGPVHEVVMSSQAKTSAMLSGVTMVIIGGGDRSTDTTKFLKDALVLEKSLQQEPNHTRNTFYLAQSYKDAGLLHKAIEVYKKRVAQGGWPEEVFWSLYQIAIIQETLGVPEDVINKGYTEAYQYRPTRIEPLYRLSSYYRRKENYLLGYALAKQGLNVPPPADPLFVDTWIYQYGLLLEYSICAYWLGKYEESYKACFELLSKKDLPQDVRECTEKNLSFAKERLVPSTSAGR